jgi:hypothetical protein
MTLNVIDSYTIQLKLPENKKKSSIQLFTSDVIFFRRRTMFYFMHVYTCINVQYGGYWYVKPPAKKVL